MTDATDPVPAPQPLPRAPVPPAAAPPEADTGWRPLPRAARAVRLVGGMILGLVAAIPLGVLLIVGLDLGWRQALVALPALVVVAVAWGAWIAARQWSATFWRLDPRGLQVRRGRLFQREVLVPRSRVQHLDLERGPIERRFGLATIVVHTAGTRLQALRQSGLAEADAVALRDALVPDADVDDDAV